MVFLSLSPVSYGRQEGFFIPILMVTQGVSVPVMMHFFLGQNAPEETGIHNNYS